MLARSQENTKPGTTAKAFFKSSVATASRRSAVDTDEVKNAFAVVPGFVFSWERANIRLGVGYSSFFVEGFYLVIPGDVLSNVAPEFDVFVRF